MSIKHVVFSVPTDTLGMHHLSITQFIGQAEKACAERGIKFTHNLVPAKPNTTTRNIQCNEFLWGYPDADAVAFCDADAIPDVPSFLLLLDAIEREDVDICYGWSLIYSDGELRPNVTGPPNAEQHGARKTDTVTPHRVGGLYEITGGAAGSHCMIVKRRVIATMVEKDIPPFEDIFYRDHDAEPEAIQKEWRYRFGTRKRGHDFLLAERAAELGFRIWLDNRVYWGHVKPVDLRDWYDQVHAMSVNVRAQLPAINLLRELWGNEDWTVSAEFLMRMANEAVRVPHDRAILELGSGLSTAVLAKCHPNVVALETNPECVGAEGSRTKKATIIYAPLEDYGEFDWYARDAVDEAMGGKPIGMLIVDGPPGTTRGGRIGCLQLRDRLAPGCVVMFDDVNRPQDLAVVEAWGEGMELTAGITTCADGRQFAVVKMPG